MDQDQFEILKQKIRKELLEKQGPIAQALRFVRYRVAVFSGKGGVGKTVITVNLGVVLHQMGYQVGIFDADLHGPAVPKCLSVLGRLPVNESHHGHHLLRFDPLLSPYGIKVVSIALIWPSEEMPIIWKGAHKMRSIRQFLAAVNWGQLDFLLIDLPPGTGDEVQTIMSSIPQLSGMIIVTSPQGISTMVCSKAINTAREFNVPVLGLVENMSGLECPHCGDKIYLFGQPKGERLARMMDVPFWGYIPISTEMGECVDKGVPVVVKYPEAKFSQVIQDIAFRLIGSLGAERPSVKDSKQEKTLHRSSCKHA